MPENHGGTFTIDAIPNVSVTSNGITRKTTVFKIIATANHTEDVLAGKYNAWLVDPTHVLLESPSTNRVLREYADAWVEAQKMYGHFDHNEHEARKIGKNQVDKDPTRQRVLVLIDFGDIQLTNEHHSPNSTEGLLHWDFTPIPTNFYNPKLPLPLPHTTTVVTWRVAATPQANQVVDQASQERDAIGELAAMMQQNTNLGQRQNTSFQQQAPFNQGGYQPQQAFGQGLVQQQGLVHQQGMQQYPQPPLGHQMQYQQQTHNSQAPGYQMQQPLQSPQQSGQHYGNQQVLSMPPLVLSPQQQPQQQGTPVFPTQQINPYPTQQQQPQQQQPQQQQPQQQQPQQHQQQSGGNGGTSNGNGFC